jgi:hypothetical protein
MIWQSILLAVVRCELQARYHCLTGWQLSAKGALPIVILGLSLLFLWQSS